MNKLFRLGNKAIDQVIIKMMQINKNFIDRVISDAKYLNKRDHRIYIPFILLWTLFEAWIKDSTNDSNTTNSIKTYFDRQHNTLARAWWDRVDRQSLIASLQIIKNVCPVDDNSRKSKKKYTIDAAKDFSNLDLKCLALVLFRLRSNLIHGNENIEDDSNIKLYGACTDILTPWLTQASVIYDK